MNKSTSVFLLCIVSFFLVFVGCSDDFSSSQDKGKDTKTQGSEYLFTLQEALSLAEKINPFPFPGDVAATKSASKHIQTYQSVGEKQPFFHIITYQEGGFVILSADKRLSPVLAYSDEDPFVFDEEMPPGLVGWMDNVSQMITEIRLKNEEPDEKVLAEWNTLTTVTTQSAGSPIVPPPFPPTLMKCPESLNSNTEPYAIIEVLTYGPLLTTKWGQDKPYNDSLSYMGCTTTLNGKLPAGCVPVAVAQVMKYHGKPTSINWSSMANTYDSNTPSPALSQLLRNLGLPSQLNVSYSCAVSTSLSSRVVPTFVNTYGYASNSYMSSFHSDNLRASLRAGRPVLIRGDSGGGVGHLWVCDGCQDYYDLSCDGSTLIKTYSFSG
jgi:hypothetical protein